MKLNISVKNELTNQGKWFDFYESRIMVAHTSNLRFQRAVLQGQQPYRKKIESGTLDPEVGRRLMCKAMSEALIINWENVTDESGTNIPFTSEAAFTALMNNSEFRDWVAEVAANYDLFKSEEVNELGKS